MSGHAQDGGDEDVRREPGLPPEFDEAGCERRRRASTRHEASDHEHVAPPVLQEGLGPLEPLPRTLAAEEPPDDRLPEPAAQGVRAVVAGERAEGSDHDHPAERELPARGLDATDDHSRLARERREDGVAEANREQQRIGPARAGQQVEQVVEECEQHHAAFRSSIARVFCVKPTLS